MAENKEQNLNPVAKLTERLREVRNQIKSNSKELKEEYLRERLPRKKGNDIQDLDDENSCYSLPRK